MASIGAAAHRADGRAPLADGCCSWTSRRPALQAALAPTRSSSDAAGSTARVFRVRQFVLTSFAAERPLLEDVAALMRASGVLVTYNGKTFDAPLIDTRFLFHRLEAPCSGLAHLDLLHPARRLWRLAVDFQLMGVSPPAGCR